MPTLVTGEINLKAWRLRIKDGLPPVTISLINRLSFDYVAPFYTLTEAFKSNSMKFNEIQCQTWGGDTLMLINKIN